MTSAGCGPCAPTSKNDPWSKKSANRSRAVSLPRSCCFATRSAPPISWIFARRASSAATRSRIVGIVSFSSCQGL